MDTVEVQKSTGVSHDTEFLINLRLSDLYKLPDEFVRMDHEIFSAMRFGNIEFLQKLKSDGTPLACFKNDKGDSILHLAASWGHLELVKGIVSECPCLLLERNCKNQIPLHVAARAGHAAVVKALVASVTYFSDRLSEEDKERLDVYILKDTDGDTPLHAALKDIHENVELLMYQKLANKGKGLIPRVRHWLRNRSIAHLDTQTSQMETAGYLVNACQRASFLANNDGVSPLYLAVEAGNVCLVNAMLNRPRINVQVKTSNLVSKLEGRKSLVHAALKAKSTSILDVILNEDPNLVNERDEDGRTCLSVGASVGYYEGICKLLDRSTSNVYECDGDGSFPIHVTVEKGHMKVVKELLKRFPDSECLLNKKGQNILHIAAKTGKAGSFILNYIKRRDRKNNHLIEEQDEDGNTPLHLATINWRPRTTFNLSEYTLTNTKILNLRNKDGLKALDIAEQNLQFDYVLRERMTLMVLLCFYAPKGGAWLPTSGMTLRSKLEPPDANKFKDKINNFIVVAALVATVAFSAGFTIPGSFKSSAPNLTTKAHDLILNYNLNLSMFLIFDTLAFLSSVAAIVALIWAQLGDPGVVYSAFSLALPSLYVALISMSCAFTFGVGVAIPQNGVIANIVTFLCAFFLIFLLFSLFPYIIIQLPGCLFFKNYTRSCVRIFVWFMDEENDTKIEASRVGESVGSPSIDQVKKS